MDSPGFKNPQLPDETVLQLQIAATNSERSDTPDSIKGLLDNDSATSSPRILKPVLGKAQAKKRLMAFANKFTTVPKLDKSKDKILNPLSIHSANALKKLSADGGKVVLKEVTDAKTRIEMQLELQDKQEQKNFTKKTKKQVEVKVPAIEEIMREEARRKLLLSSGDFDKHMGGDFSRNGRNRDRDRNCNSGRRGARYENFRRESNDYRGERRRRYSRRDRSKSHEKKEKKESSNNNQVSLNHPADTEPEIKHQSDKKDKFRDKNRFNMEKEQNKREKKDNHNQLQLKWRCWKSFKAHGGQIRSRSLSQDCSEGSHVMDLNFKTTQDYLSHLNQMLMIESCRHERYSVIVNSTSDSKKEFPPESIRTTKKSKSSSPILYSENPHISLFLVHTQLFQLLPAERCELMRAISERKICAKDKQEKDSRIRVRHWFIQHGQEKADDEPAPNLSPSVPVLPPKSKWESEDESETLPTDISNTGSDDKDIEPTSDTPEEENIPVEAPVEPLIQEESPCETTEQLDCREETEEIQAIEEPVTAEIGEKLVSEYEQFMKIVSEEVHTEEEDKNQYSPNESVAEMTAELDNTTTTTTIKTAENEEKVDTTSQTPNTESTMESEIIVENDLTKQLDPVDTPTVDAESSVEAVPEEIEKKDTDCNATKAREKSPKVKPIKTNKVEKIKERKKKKKRLSSSESTEESSCTSSESEEEAEADEEKEKRKKKRKKRRKKRSRASSTESSSSSSNDSSSDNESVKKLKKRRRKRKNKKKYRVQKRRLRRASTDSELSSSEVDELVKKRKKRKTDGRKHGKASKRSKSTSKTTEKTKIEKIKKTKNIINLAEGKNTDAAAVEKIPIELEEDPAKDTAAVSPKTTDPPAEKASPKQETTADWDNDSSSTAKESTSDKPDDLKADETKEASEKTSKIETTVPEAIESTSVNESADVATVEKTDSISQTSVEIPVENSGSKRAEISDGPRKKKSRKLRKKRGRSTSSNSSSSTSSSSSSSTSMSSSCNSSDNGSKSLKKKQRKRSKKRSFRSPKLARKLNKYKSKWSLNFDTLNFPSLTQLEQKVANNLPILDDWEVDSMDGIGQFTGSKFKSPPKSRKLGSDLQYDSQTDTYIAVDKKTSKDGKKKPSSQVRALRIWEDEEEEDAREAILSLQEKLKIDQNNLKLWQTQAATETIVPSIKLDIKKIEELQPAETQPISPEPETEEPTGWIEIVPEGGVKPAGPAAAKERVSRWTDANVEKPEDELVPVNWEEEDEQVIWATKSPQKKIDSMPVMSRVNSSELLAKADLKTLPIVKPDSKTNSPSSTKFEAVEASSDSSSDSTESSSSSESTDSEAENSPILKSRENELLIDPKISISVTSLDENNIQSKISEDSKEFLTKDGNNEAFLDIEGMKLRMFSSLKPKDITREISAIPGIVARPQKPEPIKAIAEGENIPSPLKLIPQQLITRRPVEPAKPTIPLERRGSFRSEHPHDVLAEKIATPSVSSSLLPPLLPENSDIPDIPHESRLPNALSPLTPGQFTVGARELGINSEKGMRRILPEMAALSSRSPASENRRRFSPRRDREHPRSRNSEEQGSGSSYRSNSRGSMRDFDRERGRAGFREAAPIDNRRYSPIGDREFNRRSPSLRCRLRSHSRSRSWSRSRSKSPRRRDERSLWHREKRARYSRSPVRDRLPLRDYGRRDYAEGGLERERSRDREWSRERSVDTTYDPMALLRKATVRNRESNAADDTRWRDEHVARDANDALINSTYNIKPPLDLLHEGRPYHKHDSLDREILNGPCAGVDFDRPRYRSRTRSRTRSRSRSRSRSKERRRDFDWERSRDSSESDRFGPRRGRRLPEGRSRLLRLSPRSRGSPPRKITRRYARSRSRTRSWSRSRSRSRSRTRSRSRSSSRSRSHSRLRPLSDRSRRSRSFSPDFHRGRYDDRRYRRSTSRERGRQIENIIHPSGVNPLAAAQTPVMPIQTSVPGSTPQFEYPYYASNNLTYPPRVEASANPPVSGSPKRLSLDDRLELELGIKKHQEPMSAPPIYNHSGFNAPHDVTYPPPMAPGLPPRNAALPMNSYGRSRPTVVQVGNVLQVVPGEFNTPVAPIGRNDVPTPAAAAARNCNANRVVRVGNVLQVVPTTNLDWSGNLPPPSAVTTQPLRSPMPGMPGPTAMAPIVGKATVSPNPISMPHSVPPPTLVHIPPAPAAVSIAALPKLEPPKPPPIQAVYNYQAIMEARKKEKEARKLLREEKRRAKAAKKIEKMQQRDKRRLARVNQTLETPAVSETSTSITTDSTNSTNALLKPLLEDEDPDDAVTATLGETEEISGEVDDDEEAEDEVDIMLKDEDYEEDEYEEEEGEAEEDPEDDESKTLINLPDVSGDAVTTSTNEEGCAEFSAEVAQILLPLPPAPRKGILITTNQRMDRVANGEVELDSIEADLLAMNEGPQSQEFYDEFTIGDASEEKMADTKNDKDKRVKTIKQRRSRKSVQFADGIKPGEGTSPSGCEGDMPSPPPPASSSLQDPLHELVRKSRIRKSRKKAKRVKPQKTKKKVKVKIIKLKKPRITPLTSMIMEDSDDVDDRSPPPPPPGSPPLPHLWPNYLAAYSATLRTVEPLSPLPNTTQVAPPPTPLPLLVPPPPLNYTIQPCEGLQKLPQETIMEIQSMAKEDPKSDLI